MKSPMFVRIDGKLTLLSGREDFHSAFAHRNKRVSGKAHKRLRQELIAKGYYPNGKPSKLDEIKGDIDNLPPPFNPETDDLANFSWDHMKDRMAGLTSHISSLMEIIKTPSEPTEFYGNPETGQRIPLKALIVATLLWPLEEVLALVP